MSIQTGGEKNTTVSNCYYLSSTWEGAINFKDTDETQKKTEEQMKTQEFVDALNEGNSQAVWEKDNSQKNDGYPILK